MMYRVFNLKEIAACDAALAPGGGRGIRLATSSDAGETLKPAR
jgi:hypothetical protein